MPKFASAEMMRAVLRWHGVVISDKPLGRDTAGRDRIVRAPARRSITDCPGKAWRLTAPRQPRLRIALHHGEVHTRERDSDLQLEMMGGSAILCAAWVEPVVEPGQISATEEFREQFLQRPSRWRTTALRPAGGVELFNVRKPGTSEPDLWVRLRRLES